VLAPLPLDRRSEGDAALVVAIERYPNLPAVPGARESGASWVRFLTTLFGIPDRAARRAVEIASARGAPGMLRTLHDTLAGLGAPKVVLQRVAALAARATASLATPSAQDSDHAG
jgi:hypothetical protein